MRKKSFIDIEGQGKWFKGNLHAHTNYSDGLKSPEEVANIYYNKGYDFLAITDHRVYGIHHQLSTKEMLILPGVELDSTSADTLGHHVVGIGIPGKNQYSHKEKIIYSKDASTNDLIATLHEKGNLCIYAHPNWSHIQHEYFDNIEGVIGIEVYNHTCETRYLRGYAESYYDRILSRGIRSWCFSCDDTHQKNADIGGGYIMIYAEELTQEAIIKSLISGNFYASQGPEIINFYIRDNTAHIISSPCRILGFLADTIPGFAICDNLNLVTSLSYQLNGSESYIRGVCINHLGQKAWTQPIWLS